MKKTCPWWDQMPRECSVCSHPEAFAINEALVLQKASNRRIAPQYGLSEKAIRRHREHIPQLLVKAAEAMQLDDAEHLAAELNKLKQDVHRLKDKAEDVGDLRTALLGCDKALKALELQAKVAQLIQAEGSTTVNIALIEHPDYQRLSETIYDALLDYPEARWAVADALKEIEGP